MASQIKAPTLTVRQLALVFAVTEMTIYNWQKETVSKTALPKRCTADAVVRWARNNNVSIAYQPEKVLTKFPARKPGPKPSAKRGTKHATAKATAPKLKRSGAGKLTSVKSGTAGLREVLKWPRTAVRSAAS